MAESPTKVFNFQKISQVHFLVLSVILDRSKPYYKVTYI